MPITRSSDVTLKKFEGGSELQYLATPANGAAETELLRGLVPAGETFPPHSHDREEVVYFAAGSCRYTIGDDSGVVSAGDVAVIPAGVVHEFQALEDTDALGVLPAGTKWFAPDGSEMSLE